MLKGITSTSIAAAIIAAMTLSACGTGNQAASVQRGTLALSMVRVGTPEQVFKDAIMTFVPDPNGTTADKTQYLSRLTDDNGGQYVIQAKNDECFEVDVVQNGSGIDKQTALKKMENLLPAEIVASIKPTVKNDRKLPIETYNYDGKFKGQLIYADASKTAVKYITARRAGSSVAARTNPQ
jgi:hypothetical protein